jgi:hypothetical protein
MFCERIALALFADIARAYGGAAITHMSRSGLAPWQLRACEFIDANLSTDASVSDVVEERELSGSHFDEQESIFGNEEFRRLLFST